MVFAGIFLVTLYAGVVRAALTDDGDEFSNNLFSDIGPLLALFGEQFTKQYLSQSINWLDSVIFTMAPLGIITAVVSAIRVGGPPWLRALIGRARESRAAAEVELLSSTSNEVCELWNGRGVVRTTGRPQIIHLIYFPACRDDEKVGFYTLDEAVEAGLLAYHGTQPLEKPCTGTSSDTENVSDQPPVRSDYAPNLLMNLAQHRQSAELYFWAVVGITVQLGVLVFAGLSVYRWQWKKEDDPIQGYALPLFVAGTLTLALGILLCATVIEQSSEEQIWSRGTKHPAGDFEVRLIWLQQRHVVSDQYFDAAAIFARGKRQYIMTSHPCTRNSQEPERVAPHVLSSALGTNWREASTLLGTLMSLGGFVVQFVALRSLHWSVSVAQLGATGTMTIVRAWLRRGLTETPHAEPLEENHEMDWLSLITMEDPEIFWANVDNGKKAQNYTWEVLTGDYPSKNECARRHGNTNQYKAGKATSERSYLDRLRLQGRREFPVGTDCEKKPIATSNNYKSATNNSPPRAGESELAPEPASDDLGKLFAYRLSLRLHQPESPPSELAGSLASTIETVMGFLGTVYYNTHDNPEVCSPGTESSTKKVTHFTWGLKVSGGYPDVMKHGEIYLTVRKTMEGLNEWRIDSTKLDAVLSLWLYNFRRDGRKNIHRRRTKAQWNRRWGKQLSFHNIRILAPGEAAKLLDCLKLFMDRADFGSALVIVREVDSEEIRRFGYDEQLLVFERDLVTGIDREIPDVTTETNAARVRTFQRLPGDSNYLRTHYQVPEIGPLYLAMIELAPIGHVFAQQIFSKFMWQAIQCYESMYDKVNLRRTNKFGQGTNWFDRGSTPPDYIEQETVATRGTQHNQELFDSVQLSNSLINGLARKIASGGLVTYEAALTHILPPMVCSKKGIDLYPLVQMMRENMQKPLGSEEPGSGQVDVGHAWPSVNVVDDLLRVTRFCYEVSGALDDGTIQATILLVDALRHRIKPSFDRQMDEKTKLRPRYEQQLKDLRSQVLKCHQGVVQLTCRAFEDAEMEGWDHPLFAEIVRNSSDFQSQWDRLYLPEKSRYNAHARTRLFRRPLEDQPQMQTETDIIDASRRDPKEKEIDIFHRQTTHRAALTRDALVAVMVHVNCMGFYHDEPDVFGWTPAHYASWLGVIDYGYISEDILFKVDADKSNSSDCILNKQTPDGLTILDCAAKNTNPEYFKELISRLRLHAAKVSVDHQAPSNTWGITPLGHACYPYQEEMVEYLLQEGANPYLADHWGRTPLERAALSGPKAAYQVLTLSLHAEPEDSERKKSGLMMLPPTNPKTVLTSGNQGAEISSPVRPSNGDHPPAVDACVSAASMEYENGDDLTSAFPTALPTRLRSRANSLP